MGWGADKYQATTTEGDEPTGARAGLQGQGVEGVKDASTREGDQGWGQMGCKARAPRRSRGAREGY